MKDNEALVNLIEDCVKNDRKSQREFYERTLPYLRATISRYLFHQDSIQDVLQETYIKIYKYLKRYDANKGGIMSWISKIAVNTTITHNKKSTKMKFKDTNNFNEITWPNAIELMTVEEVIGHLQKMPTNLYIVFSMFVIEGYSHREIASISGITEEVSRQRLTRARKWVRTSVGSHSLEKLVNV